MKCNHCGKELADGSRFCKYCGKPQAEPTSAAQGEASAQAAASEEKAAASAALAQQPAMSAVPTAQPAPAAAPAQGAQTAQSGGSPVPPVKVTFGQQFRALFIAFSGTGGLAPAMIFGVLGLLLALAALGGDSIVALLSAILLLAAASEYIFSGHQFWRAAGIECGLQLTLPAGRTDAEWLAHIRDGFSYEGAARQDSEDENAVVYRMEKTPMCVTVQNGVLRIKVTHTGRFHLFDTGRSELKESMAADDLLCALAYYLRGEALPADFAQRQKIRHKDKVNKGKIVAFIALAVALIELVALGTRYDSALGALQRSTWDNYSTTQTLGEAFDQNFDDGKWSSQKTGDGTLAVFTGVMDLSEEGIGTGEVRFEFEITKSEDYYYFQLERVAVDGEYLPDEYEAAMLRYGFDGDLMALGMALLY